MYTYWSSMILQLTVFWLRQKRWMSLIALSFTVAVVSPLFSLSEKDLIESMVIKKNRVEYHVHPDFNTRFLREDFFVEYDEDLNLEKLDRSLVIMPLIMQLISLIWISGEIYYVDALDAKLYESLKKLKRVFKILYPKTLFEGELIPRKLVNNTISNKLDPKKYCALLYSGGLDSTVSSYYLADKKQLLITAWGQWDVPLDKKDLWQERKKMLMNYARSKKHTNAFLKSNYTTFLKWDTLNALTPEISHWRMEAIEGIGWAGLTAPILFTKGYTTLYIASSENWEMKYPCMSIPYVDDNIQFSQCRFKHHLFKFSRFDKIQWLAQERRRLGIDTLEIKGCSQRTAKNCLNCRRCLQTIGALILLGEDYRLYGYPLSRELAIKRMKDFVTYSTVNYEDIYNYVCLVRFLKELQGQGKEIEDFAWLLDKDFQPSRALDVRNQVNIDWKKLDQEFPDIRASSE